MRSKTFESGFGYIQRIKWKINVWSLRKENLKNCLKLKWSNVIVKGGKISLMLRFFLTKKKIEK